MPPKNKVTKSEIVSASLELVRAEGPEALRARSVAACLGVSTQPIFSHYASMEVLRADVIAAASEEYEACIREEMAAMHYPAYKASGMAYIQFARQQRELFKLLFMRDRSEEADRNDTRSIEPLLELLQRNVGLTREAALLFHMEMWAFVHGLAVMIATNYLELGQEQISSMVSDMYWGLRVRFEKENADECH